MNAIKNKLNKDTAYVLKEKYSISFCNEIKSFIDQFKDDNIEKNYGNSETRIWDSENKNKNIMKFKNDSDKLVSSIFGKNIECYTVLALKNIAIPSDGTQVKGRWHVDSLRKQVKVFTFLSDVKEENGPFEYVPFTNSYWFKLKRIGNYLSVMDFFNKNGSRKYQKLKESFIKKVLNKFMSKKFICDMGTTAIVDTSALHRASPCIKGTRYYLCAYYNFV